MFGIKFVYWGEDNIIIPVKSKVEIITTDQGNSSIIIMFTNALNEEII